MRNLFLGTALLVLALPSTVFGQPVRQLAVVARHVVYDGVSQRLFASVASRGAYEDRIAIIEPRSGVVERYISVGATPNRLALSDDGRFLYVGLDGEYAVRRVLLPSLTPEDRFDLGTSVWGTRRYAIDLAVLPGATGSFAVVLGTSSVSGPIGVAVFDGGNQRPRIVGYSVDQIAFGANSSELYGLDRLSPSSFYRMAVDETGVVLVEQTYRLGGGTEDHALFERPRLHGPRCRDRRAAEGRRRGLPPRRIRRLLLHDARRRARPRVPRGRPGEQTARLRRPHVRLPRCADSRARQLLLLVLVGRVGPGTGTRCREKNGCS